MGKFYTANQEFENYLLELGFTFHTRVEKGETEEVKYYTEHTTGKQVKINFKSNLVTLLDKYGRTEDESSSYTDNQIIKFLKK